MGHPGGLGLKAQTIKSNISGLHSVRDFCVTLSPSLPPLLSCHLPTVTNYQQKKKKKEKNCPTTL